MDIDGAVLVRSIRPEQQLNVKVAPSMHQAINEERSVARGNNGIN